MRVYCPFESEIRFFIDNIDAFTTHLLSLGATKYYEYEFIDHYHTPAFGQEGWDSFEKNIRIREWIRPTTQSEILLARNECVSIDGYQFKRSVYESGKVTLFSGSHDEAINIITDLGFTPWVAIHKKHSHCWELPDGSDVIVEYIDGLGWIGELELDGSEANHTHGTAKKLFDTLHVPEDKQTPDTTLSLYLQATKK